MSATATGFATIFIVICYLDIESRFVYHTVVGRVEFESAAYISGESDMF